MPPKTNTKSEPEAPAGASTALAVAPARTMTQWIAMAVISTSKFEPQAKRRARFTEEDIADLAANIAANGMIQAITVRPVGREEETAQRHYEIVAGERRYLAAKSLGWEEIECTVRELTDEQAFDIQLAENLKRTDVHPIDEAYSYEYLQKRFGYDVDAIALHVGQKPAYVAPRLKLLTLDKPVLEAFEKNEILFGHALEIAKYKREDHKLLLGYCFTDPNSSNRGLVSVPRFIQRLEEHFHRRLSKAPFPVKSEHLRPDGLACPKCPERTGANVLLFEGTTTRKDSCLNPKCWDQKTQAFVQIQRIRAALGDYDPAAEISEQDKKSINKIPLVAGKYLYYGEPRPENYVDYHDFDELKKPGECDKAESGVFFNGDRVGQIVHFCRDTSCKKHRGKYLTSSSSSSGSQASIDEKRKRKEEIFDVKVGEAVRKQIFLTAAEQFAEECSVLGAGQNFLPQLVAKLWATANNGSPSRTKEVIIRAALADWAPEIAGLHLSSWDAEENYVTFEQCPETVLKHLLFLFVHADKGNMYGGNWRSQRSVRALAEEYGINYDLLDARERKNQAPNKHKEVFNQYLDAVERGVKGAKIPRVYFPGYKPKD